MDPLHQPVKGGRIPEESVPEGAGRGVCLMPSDRGPPSARGRPTARMMPAMVVMLLWLMLAMVIVAVSIARCLPGRPNHFMCVSFFESERRKSSRRGAM